MPAITRRMVSDIPPTLDSYGKGDEGRGADFLAKNSLNKFLKEGLKYGIKENLYKYK